MKKVVFYFVSLLLVFASVSCSSETESVVAEKSESNQEAVSLLKEDIAAINNAYLPQQSSKGVRRMPKWLRWIISAAADAGGTLLSGDLSTGISASTLIWNVTKEEKSVATDKNFKTENIGYIEPNSLGDMHNRITRELYEKYGDKVDTMSIQTIVERVAEVSHKSISSTEKEKMIRMLTVVKDNFDTNSSISENINRLKTLADTQDKKDALEISGMVLDGLQYVEDADTTYIKRIDRTITDSNINPNLKRMVKDGVSVANASALLWNGDAVR